MSVVFANITRRENNVPGDYETTSVALTARAIFPNQFVDYVKENCKTGDVEVHWNPDSMAHPLNQGGFNNKTIFVVSDTLDDIYARMSMVAVQAIDVTPDWKDGFDIVPERHLINLQHIAYIADRPLDFLEYTDHNKLSDRGLACDEGYTYILIEMEGMQRTLIRVEGDIEDIVAQLCGGAFLDDCAFPAIV